MADALSVISLEQAKEFLVVDFDDRDAEITRHIKSAIGYVETYTNHMLYSRAKVYTILGSSGCTSRGSIEIYDYPITVNTTVSMTTHNVLSITLFGTANQAINTTVGYNSVNDIPGQILEAAYKLITYLFENKDIYSAGLPWDVQLLLNQWRRSATI